MWRTPRPRPRKSRGLRATSAGGLAHPRPNADAALAVQAFEVAFPRLLDAGPSPSARAVRVGTRRVTTPLGPDRLLPPPRPSSPPEAESMDLVRRRHRADGWVRVDEHALALKARDEELLIRKPSISSPHIWSLLA